MGTQLEFGRSILRERISSYLWSFALFSFLNTIQSLVASCCIFGFLLLYWLVLERSLDAVAGLVEKRELGEYPDLS